MIMSKCIFVSLIICACHNCPLSSLPTKKYINNMIKNIFIELKFGDFNFGEISKIAKKITAKLTSCTVRVL